MLMHSSRWNDDFLDKMRLQGDPPADEVIASLFAQYKIQDINQLLNELVQNDQSPSEALPKQLRDFLDWSAALPPLDVDLLRKGEAAFEAHGLKLMLVLGNASLPTLYAVEEMAKILATTAALRLRPIKRLVETLQMVVDVLCSQGLAPQGRGIRTIQKVRLMHAAVRHFWLNQRARHPDEPRYVPINQEELAWTFVAFTLVAMEGSARLGVPLAEDEQEAYLYVWRVVGRLLGIRPELLPEDMAELRSLARAIAQRRIGPSKEGQELTAAFIQAVKARLPWFLSGLPASTMHFLLDHLPFTGSNLSKVLAFPKANWTKALLVLVRRLDGTIHKVGRKWLGGPTLQFLGRTFLKSILFVEEQGTRPSFNIPTRLRDSWRLKG
jgi:uncharacterized protein (DUF2236 family)